MLNKLLFSPHHLPPFLAGFLQLSSPREVYGIGLDSCFPGISPMEENAPMHLLSTFQKEALG